MKRNTIQKNGIFSFSLFFLFSIFIFSVALIEATGKKYDIQIFATNLRGKLKFNKIKDYGIDNIIIRTFQNKEKPMGLLFNNRSYKIIDPLLDKLIIERRVAEKFNEVTGLYGWLITRNFSWEEDYDLFDYKYIDGELERIKKYDLFNDSAVNKIISIYKELAEKQIDGILIQDDLIIKFNEGITNFGTAEFERVTGVSANIQKMIKSGNYYNTEWVKIKKKKIIKVLSKIISEVKKVNPQIKIGMNLYYETPLFIKNSELWYSHNLKEILENRIDFIYLMSYQRQIKDEMKLSEKKNIDMFRKIVNEAYKIAGEKLIVKIQVYDWKSKKRVSKREILKYLKLIPRGVKRICFTPVKVKDLIFIKKIIRKAR